MTDFNQKHLKFNEEVLNLTVCKQESLHKTTIL